VCLQLAVRSPAYQVLADLPADTIPEVGYELLTKALRERFGESPMDNLETVATLHLEDCTSATEYTQRMQAAVRQLFSRAQDPVNELMRLAVFRGLPRDHPSTTALRPMALEKEMEATKMVEAIRVQFQGASSKGTVAATTVEKKSMNACLICSRTNHETKDCFYLARARKGIQKVCTSVFSLLSGSVPLVLIPMQNLICLVDTGSERTLVSRPAIQKLATGSQKTSGTTKLLTVGGKEQIVQTHTTTISLTNLKIEILVLPVPYLVHVGGTPVDVILGQDWLQAQSPVTFESMGGALVLKEIQGQHVPLIEVPFKRGDTWRHDVHNMIRVGAAVDTTTYDRVVLDSISYSDFVARKVASQGQVFWEAEWKWINGEPNQRAFRPGTYKGQMASITPLQKEQYYAEIQKWKDLGFVSRAKGHEIKRTVTLMAVAQDHKETTPCRPVMDCKPLNSLILSKPNEDDLVTCADAIRRWRTVRRDANGVERKWVLIDIKKAYLQIRMTEECSRHLGLTLTNPESGEEECWRMDRLPFGLNISPKVLRTILRHILKQNGLDAEVDIYVDDAKVWTNDIQAVRQVFAENGFEIKDPEPAELARVLGLQRVPGHRWRRRAEIPMDVGSTFTELRSWAAIVACAHYPVLRWLRPAVRYLERLGRVATTQMGYDVLPDKVVSKWQKLIEMIREAGDPTGGRFMVDASLPWTLYTDASNVGLGGALYFGTELVEDVSWLRKLGDVRPIDTVELEAVVKSINSLVLPWMRALDLKSIHLKLYVDNQPVVGQINRRHAAHSVRPSGYTQGVAEARLQTIEELIQLYSIELDCQYVPSAENKADHLTRIPAFLVDPELKGYSEVLLDDQIVATVVIPRLTETAPEITLEEVTRATDAESVRALVRKAHDHEGGLALYNRLRRWLKPNLGLLNICREVVRDCAVCRQYKTQANQNADELLPTGRKRKRRNEKTRHRSRIPFNKVHMDVVGNFRVEAGSKQYFVLTLVDSASGYGLALASKLAPSAADVVWLLQHLAGVYHASPLLLMSDGGSIFTSEETAHFLRTHRIQLKTTAKNSSKSNGKVERFHRTLEEFLRTHARGTKVGWFTFQQLVKRAVNHYNTTPFDGTSAHERVFKFPPVDPIQPTELRDEYHELRDDHRQDWPKGFAEQSPVLVRNFRRENKLAPYWIPAVIAKRVGPLTYTLVGFPGKFALKDIKSNVDSRIMEEGDGVA
jgi:transposase InsO family protein